MSKLGIRVQFFFDQNRDAIAYQNIIKRMGNSIMLNSSNNVLSSWKECKFMQNSYGSIVLLDEWKDFPEIKSYLDSDKTDKLADSFFNENEVVFQHINVSPQNIIISFKGEPKYGEQFYVYCERMMEPALKEFLRFSKEWGKLKPETRSLFERFPEKISWCYRATMRTGLAFMEDDPDDSCVNLNFLWDEVENAVIDRIFKGTFSWCVSYMKKEARYNGKVIFFENEH